MSPSSGSIADLISGKFSIAHPVMQVLTQTLNPLIDKLKDSLKKKN